MSHSDESQYHPIRVLVITQWQRGKGGVASLVSLFELTGFRVWKFNSAANPRPILFAFYPVHLLHTRQHHHLLAMHLKHHLPKVFHRVWLRALRSDKVRRARQKPLDRAGIYITLVGATFVQYDPRAIKRQNVNVPGLLARVIGMCARQHKWHG